MFFEVRSLIKYRMEYIETEFARRHNRLSAEDSKMKNKDPAAELYRIPEKYHLTQSLPEGDKATSSAMLTGVLEADLGIEYAA